MVGGSAEICGWVSSLWEEKCKESSPELKGMEVAVETEVVGPGEQGRQRNSAGRVSLESRGVVNRLVVVERRFICHGQTSGHARNEAVETEAPGAGGRNVVGWHCWQIWNESL